MFSTRFCLIRAIISSYRKWRRTWSSCSLVKLSYSLLRKRRCHRCTPPRLGTCLTTLGSVLWTLSCCVWTRIETLCTSRLIDLSLFLSSSHTCTLLRRRSLGISQMAQMRPEKTRSKSNGTTWRSQNLLLSQSLNRLLPHLLSKLSSKSSAATLRRIKTSQSSKSIG